MKEGPNPGVGLAILRIVIGIIFLAHGGQKLTGGLEGTIGFFGQLGIPLPTLAAWFIALLETLGGVALIVGYLVTPIAVLLAIHMVMGIFLVHLSNGFWVIGPGTGGIEFNLVLAAGLLALVFAGAGTWSLQERFQKDIQVA
ncbi:MAG: DoxX family protein [Gemmatimonadota bacterium]|nr:DoxX family protein [Gemmatimonadota bacterium]